MFERDTTAITNMTGMSRDSHVEGLDVARNTGIFGDIPI